MSFGCNLILFLFFCALVKSFWLPYCMSSVMTYNNTTIHATLFIIVVWNHFEFKTQVNLHHLMIMTKHKSYYNCEFANAFFRVKSFPFATIAPASSSAPPATTTPIKLTQTVCENMLCQMLYSGNKIMISSVNATIFIQREQYSTR